MDEIIEKLKDKDEKAAYEFAKKIGIESAESDKYVEKIPVFSEMLTDKNSYVRTRAFMLICNQARWADKGQIEVVFNRMKELLNDAKPTVVRQCLGALHLLCQRIFHMQFMGKNNSKCSLLYLIKLYQVPIFRETKVSEDE